VTHLATEVAGRVNRQFEQVVDFWHLAEKLAAAAPLLNGDPKRHLASWRMCLLNDEEAAHQYQLLRTECGPAVNVRIANATGRPGELLADTIGLAELGLPDLQIVFSDRDPSEVARRLRSYVRRLLVGERLDCAWIEEVSLVPPERDALTLFDDPTPVDPPPLEWR
jgi:hypothetical protein